MQGFRLRVHWNKYQFKYEDVVKMVEVSPNAVFNFRVRDENLITFHEALKLIYVTSKRPVRARDDGDSLSREYNQKGLKLVQALG